MITIAGGMGSAGSEHVQRAVGHTEPDKIWPKDQPGCEVIMASRLGLLLGGCGYFQRQSILEHVLWAV